MIRLRKLSFRGRLQLWRWCANLIEEHSFFDKITRRFDVMKKILFLLSFALLTLHGAKPVGLWQGNSWQRVGELLKATLFNPQWTHDKPEFKIV